MSQAQFSTQLLHWFDQHGRKELPWQQNKTPYRVWVAEIMLQQTQVSAVIPYYQRFMQRFGSIQSLAAAGQDEVLHHWSGLGYYARGRNLHKAAQQICEQYSGQFPDHIDAVQALPGIGKSTAGAILACAMGQRHAILDGNVKRVLSRYHTISGYPGQKAIENQLWELAEQHTPTTRIGDYTQAIMDLGATLCTRSKPRCMECPLQETCKALATNQVSTLPTPKPKQKSRRQESEWMLLLLDEHHACAMLKRPAAGIWGGLWCPLQFANYSALQDWCHTQGINPERLQELGAPIDHSFSHYDLCITPLYLSLSKIDKQRLSKTNEVLGNATWTKQNSKNIGLPAPVKQILTRLHD